jgi:hypothetical protein
MRRRCPWVSLRRGFNLHLPGFWPPPVHVVPRRLPMIPREHLSAPRPVRAPLVGHHVRVGVEAVVGRRAEQLGQSIERNGSTSSPEERRYMRAGDVGPAVRVRNVTFDKMEAARERLRALAGRSRRPDPHR